MTTLTIPLMSPQYRDKQHAVKMPQQGVSSARLRAPHSSRNEPPWLPEKEGSRDLSNLKTGISTIE